MPAGGRDKPDGMSGDDQMRRNFEQVLERMLRAGWIKEFTFTEAKGFHIVWTEEGGLNAVLLKQWYKDLALGDADDLPMFACIIADGWAPDKDTPFRFGEG